MYLPAPDSGRRFQTAVILFSSKFIVFTFSTEISYTGWSERSVSIVFHAVTLSMNFHLVEVALSMKLRSAIHKENTLEWLISRS